MILNKLSWILIAIFLVGIGVPTPIETSVPESQIAIPATTATVMQNPYPTAEGGPLDPNPEITVTAFVDGPATYTMTLSNAAGRPLSTAHYVNNELGAPDTPSLIGNPQPGVFAAGASHVLLAPRGWAGNVAIGESRFGLPGAWASLIEGSFKQQLPAASDWLWAIDVSYVAGYTVPIVCYCGSVAADNRSSGCAESLFTRYTCPAENFDAAKGACRNPKKDDDKATNAVPFFELCQHLAYTYPGDHLAVANGKCQKDTTTCIILPDNGPH